MAVAEVPIHDARIPEEREEQLVPVVTLPPGYTVTSYLQQAKLKISGLVIKFRKPSAPVINAELQGYVTFLRTFLPWLETDAPITPTIRTQTKLDTALSLLFDPKNKCPEDIATLARRAFDKLEEEQWGAANGQDESSGDEEAEAMPHQHRQLASSPTKLSTNDMYTLTRPPPPEHHIWGRKGIMHGFINQPSQLRKFNYVFDPRCKHEKRSSKVFGHNSLKPGGWWPYLKVALFHGAHGHSMAGISGRAELGAWSIVVSGSSKYEDMDQDLGDTIWYSSDQSHENTDPLHIRERSNMTLSLHSSLGNGKPVRVLRSSGKGHFAPSCGIRYDGLYSVLDVVERKNAKGGLFEQFKLVRQPDQPPLQEIRLSSPTSQQVDDFARVREGY